jgi:alpha-glucoside transport system substrate-binding protein
MKSRWLRVLALVAVLAMVAAACSGESSGDGDGDGGTDGTEATDGGSGDDTGFITVQGSETSDAEAGSNEKAFADYGAESGVTVSFAGSRSFSDNINIAVAAGNPPDVGFIPQPGKVADFARQGSIVQLPDEVAQANQDAYGTFANFGVVDGDQYGVTVKTDLKSLVWYKPQRFADAGYEVPTTFDDLVALTDQMIADGETPWCVGIESGGATGWAFTDWVEDLMLRFHGADVYDEWVSHEIPFNDERVQEVWQAVLDLWNRDGAVYAAGGAIATTSFSDNAVPLEEDECWMHRQANFFASFFTPGYPIGPGDDADRIEVFYFPGDGESNPVLSAGVVAVAFNDRPEVMDFMAWLGGPGFAEARQKYQAETQGGTSGYLSAAEGQDMSVYNEFETSLIEILQSADVARFDGSDLMPSAVGAGTFWTEATAAVNGDKTVAEATQTIEDSWPDS